VSVDVRGVICFWERNKTYFFQELGYYRPKLKIQLDFNPTVYR
jgi:hypothetical protein